jgi:transketolase
MKMLPNMTVINPCDFNQTKAATLAAAKFQGPIYLRFGRPKVPNFTPSGETFEIGKAIRLNEGADVSIFATGHLVWHALEAAKILEDQGYTADIINLHTIKPLDVHAIKKSLAKTGCAVTAEEHMMNGGLGDSIAQIIVRECPLPMEMIAINDTFGESGKPEELMNKFGLDAEHIVRAATRVMARKEQFAAKYA